MKRIISLLIIFVVLVQCSATCFAQEIPVIFADEVILNFDEIQPIPVNIKGNTGIMGFKFTIKYPEEYIEIVSVASGSVTREGIFNTNAGLKTGTVNIIWSDTSQTTENGTLFVLSAKLKKKLTNNITIDISSSLEDTFNENFDNVELDCKNIEVNAKYDVASANNQTEKSELITENDLQIIETVKITLEQSGIQSLSEVTDTNNFVESFNKNLETIIATDKYNATNFDELKNMYSKAYETKFIENVTNYVDADVICSAINGALDSLDLKSIDNINKSDEDEFVKLVEESLKNKSDEIQNISKDLEADDAVKIIKGLYDSVQEEQNKEVNNNSVSMFLIIVSVIIAAIIALCATFIKKRKH